MSHKKLSNAERAEIGILLTKGYSHRSIAEQLERSHSTISDEIRRNSVDGIYRPKRAGAKARIRQRLGRLGWKKIEQVPTLKKFITEHLALRWSPDEIAGYLKRTSTDKTIHISKNAIYKWLRTSRGERYCVHLYSQRTFVKKYVKKTTKVMIPARISIAERPVGASERTEAGHYERDTVVSRKGTAGGVSTSVERISRLLSATKVGSMKPGEHAAVVVADSTKYLTKSVTYDNGIENRNHVSTGITSYFCAPYHSWEKGSVENANKLLRWFFPKKTDFSHVTQDEVDEAVRLINNKPRKILGYKSSLEVARELGIILSESGRMRCGI
jgi:transposase, IS30 family